MSGILSKLVVLVDRKAISTAGLKKLVTKTDIGSFDSAALSFGNTSSTALKVGQSFEIKFPNHQTLFSGRIASLTPKFSGRELEILGMSNAKAVASMFPIITETRIVDPVKSASIIIHVDSGRTAYVKLDGDSETSQLKYLLGQSREVNGPGYGAAGFIGMITSIEREYTDKRSGQLSLTIHE